MNDPAQLALTPAESTWLVECEAVIQKGLKTFVEVGSALLEIRDNCYYRQDFDTFENSTITGLRTGAGGACDLGVREACLTKEMRRLIL